jgi:hypothetical protein
LIGDVYSFVATTAAKCRCRIDATNGFDPKKRTVILVGNRRNVGNSRQVTHEEGRAHKRVQLGALKQAAFSKHLERVLSVPVFVRLRTLEMWTQNGIEPRQENMNTGLNERV